MRAIQIMAPGRPELIEVPVPTPEPGFGLVRPLLIALCGSDVRSVYYTPEEEYPLPVSRGGHETIARVEAMNGSAPGVQEGDIVMALAPGDAGMSEYFTTPLHCLLPLPEGGPLEHLLMAQQLGTVIFASKRLPNVVGKDTVVIGQGSAGLFFDVILHRSGAARVIALDLIETRAQAGLTFGATHAVNNSRVDALQAVEEITEGRLADLVIEAAGEPDSINLMPRLAKEHGNLMSFGIPRGPHSFEFDYYTMFRKKCHWNSSDGTIEEPEHTSTKMALDLIARGEIEVGSMVTHHFPFDRVKEAYELARTRADGAIKIVVEMPS